MGIKNRVKEATVLVVSFSMVLSLALSTTLKGEDSNITNTTTSTVTSTNTNTNNNTNNNTINSTSVATNNNNNINTSTITATNNNTNINTSTSNVTSNITQTQDVTNTSTITSIGTNTNTSTSTSTNNNTNLNTNNSTSISSVSTESINQNTNQNTNINTNSNTSTSVSENSSTQKVTQRIKTAPPSAIAPSIMSYSQDLCTTGASSAVQTQFFGVSSGRSVRDENCERLKNSKALYDMGMKVAAVALLCENPGVWRSMMQAGTPCPYKGKIGQEAKLAWEENPQDRPDWEEVKKEISTHEFKAYKKKDFCKRYSTHKLCSD
tara:strand:+ start:7733 stop:8698 length:966 start_codon:yes stop_codon:yes gene_type:complete